MSIRSVDMQHTLQQTAQVERVQAVDRGQADQQNQQMAQHLDRLTAHRQRAVYEAEESAEERRLDDATEDDQGQGRRRRGRRGGSGPDEQTSASGDGEVHLIDIRV
jgi:hypothetical protein